VAGDNGRSGGVPNRGGGEPMELERAAASAETPGPGRDDSVAGPARGVKAPGKSIPTWLGVGICRTDGVPGSWPEGTGEANRAVEVARGTELTCERPLAEPGEDATGTGKGREEEPSRGVDMASVEVG
jgi:hypothetical protein